MSNKLSIFDLDGVLVDLCPAHRYAFKTAIQAFGFDITTEQETELEGLPTRVKLERLSIPKELHKQINEAKQQATQVALDSLETRHNIWTAVVQASIYGPVAVYSNSIRDTIAKALEKTKLKPFIDYVVSAEDVQFAKPHPEGYRKVMAEFGYSPEDTVIFEDSPHGIRAATRSGAFVAISDINTLDARFVRQAHDLEAE